jgi:hypothetical protein
MHRQGRNRRQVLLPDKGMGAGTTTFRAVLKMGHARDARLLAMRNPRQVSLPDKSIPHPRTTFTASRRASTVRKMMGDAPACGS